MLLKIIVTIATELILLLSICFLRKAYKNKDSLIWFTDYELIENLQGTQRETYLHQSLKMTSKLFYSYLILFPIILIASSIHIIFYLSLSALIVYTIYILYHVFQLQKEYTNKVQ